MPAHLSRLSRAAALPLLTLAASAGAQSSPAEVTLLDPVVVTAGGALQRAFDTPYAVSVVGTEALRAGGLMVNLSEALASVPGLTINSRNNYAQDLQISSRGFGARATFGVRGIRLYTDGIPATGPDGQGQVSHFDLAGADRVEVLRGPFSALYGNGSGGVISLVSSPATTRQFEVAGDIGSNGTHQLRVGIETPFGNGFDVRAQAARFETDGFRPQSEARRELANVRLGWRGDFDTVVVLANRLDQPADDPLGLIRAQFAADPFQTTPQALQYDTRKTTRQSQLGLRWEHSFAGLSSPLRSAVTAYAGERSVTQWQSIPASTQAAASSPGGVIAFDREYQGLDARLMWRGERVNLVAGLSFDRQGEDRRGYQNFLGSGAGQQLGVTGALRRQERNVARATDAYAQAEVDLGHALTGTLGVRSGSVRYSSQDEYLSNGDDSGRVQYHYTTPVAALLWKATPTTNLYVSASRGSESPTLGELAYRSGGQAGFNTGLRAQSSHQFELGAKWRDPQTGLSADGTLFKAQTSDEIGVLANSGGRSTYQNVGRTLRQGAELAARWQASKSVHALLSLTWLDATYRDSFSTPNGVVSAGSRIAGTSNKSAYAEAGWRGNPLGLAAAQTELGVELRSQGSLPVNDVNSDFAAGATTLALRASQRFAVGSGSVEVQARLDNATDRRYAGSVIVNESNARYFEPAAGRAWLLSVRWRQGF
nr:TonB-dependent receptor [uncultured Roseateles sp.]